MVSINNKLVWRYGGYKLFTKKLGFIFSSRGKFVRAKTYLACRGDWEREWREKRERGAKVFCFRAPTPLHIFHFLASWKDQVIEKEKTIQRPRLHRCQWKASEVLEYYTLGSVFVFLSHGGYGKKWLSMTTPEKCFPSGSCIIVSMGDETLLFPFRWAMSMGRQRAGQRGREGGMDREREEECVCERDLVWSLNAKSIEM